MTCSPGALGRLWWNAGADAPMEFLSENLVATDTLSDNQFIRGTLDRYGNSTRLMQRIVAGSINTIVTDQSIQLFYGGLFGGSLPFSAPPNPPDILIKIDRVAEIMHYTGCKVNTVILDGAAGGPLNLTAEMIGKTESIGAAGTGVYGNTEPHFFSQLGFTFNSVAYLLERLTLRASNNIVPRVFNTQTNNEMCAQDFVAELTIEGTFGNLEAIWTNTATVTPRDAVITFGNTTITLNDVIFPRVSPGVAGKSEVMLSLTGRAHAAISPAAPSMKVEQI